MPAGPEFVDQLKRAWDSGDAVFPLDQRLPEHSRNLVIDAMAPTVMVTADGNRATRSGKHVEPGDALVMATSGTTGIPKGVVLTHDAVAASARAVHERLSITSHDRWLACLPLSHVGGLSVITRSLVMGTRLHVADKFSPEVYIDAAEDGCTLVSLVATALTRIDPTLYRTIVLGGAHPPKDRPSNVVATYGMTETGSGIVYEGYPLSGVEIKIEQDEICVRASMLFRTYRDGTCPINSDGWFATGDLGQIDTNGQLHVHGRKGDLIITGGENVWPEQVEQALRTDSRIQDVCVVGLLDPEWGHIVAAFVVSDHEISLEEARETVKTILPAYCAPKIIQRVTEIPRTALGKPQRSALITST